MALLDQVFQTLGGVGLFQFGLPLLVTFAIVYGILDRIDLFEQPRINGIIAVVAGFFVANFAGNAGAGIGLFMSNFFGAFAVVLVFLVGIMMAIELGSGGADVGRKDTLHKAVLFIGALALVAIFISWGGLSLIGVPAQVDGLFLDQTSVVTLLIILAAVGLIYYVVKE